MLRVSQKFTRRNLAATPGLARQGRIRADRPGIRTRIAAKRQGNSRLVRTWKHRAENRHPSRLAPPGKSPRQAHGEVRPRSSTPLASDQAARECASALGEKVTACRRIRAHRKATLSATQAANRRARLASEPADHFGPAHSGPAHSGFASPGQAVPRVHYVTAP